MSDKQPEMRPAWKPGGEAVLRRKERSSLSTLLLWKQDACSESQVSNTEGRGGFYKSRFGGQTGVRAD